MTAAATPAADAAEAKPTPNAFADAARFGLMLAALFGAALLTVAAVVWLVPEGNDYAMATLRKHERLETAPGQRVILVGGSNLAFGIDSPILQQETGLTPVNMGMNGYFGVRYMLSEIRDGVRAGDVVVIAFEWDNYFKSIDGDPNDLTIITKANPRAWSYLSWGQRARVLVRGIPYAAQQKVLRLMRQGVDALRPLLGASERPRDESFELVGRIERADGFTPEGDLTTHLGVAWTEPHEQGIDLTANGIDPEVIPHLAAFAREMEERGVTVIISYTAVMRSFYDAHAAVIDEVHARILAAGLTAPRPPADYVYEEPLFFDTVYHLNAEGRGPRTRQLAGDVQRVLSQRRTPSPPQETAP